MEQKIKGGVEGGAAVYNDLVYFGAGDGYFYALDIETGAPKWKFPIRFEGLAAPTAHDGTVFVLAGNNVFML